MKQVTFATIVSAVCLYASMSLVYYIFIFFYFNANIQFEFYSTVLQFYQPEVQVYQTEVLTRTSLGDRGFTAYHQFQNHRNFEHNPSNKTCYEQLHFGWSLQTYLNRHSPEITEKFLNIVYETYF